MSDVPAADYRPESDADAEQVPLLDQFRGLFQTPQAQEVADVAASKVEAFNAVRRAAEDAQAEADTTVSHIANTKDNLVAIAERDPVMMPLALDLARTFIPPLVADDGPEHAAPLTDHIQSAIARAGIYGFALRDETAARQALDRYGSFLNDDDRAGLTQFIDTMGLARATDQVTAQIETQRSLQTASDTSAYGHLARLTDPGTGDVRFPGDWLQSVVADRAMTPETKAVLWRAHDTLLREGDPIASDPRTVVDLVSRALTGDTSPTDVWRHAGVDLSLADTQMLAGAAFPKTAEQRREVAAFAETLAAARRVLTAPEYGIAGQEAFGRFVNWLLPEYRRAGPGSLDPRGENWILGDPNGGPGAIANFIPNPGDIIAGPMRALGARDLVGRPSLADIFGRRK